MTPPAFVATDSTEYGRRLTTLKQTDRPALVRFRAHPDQRGRAVIVLAGTYKLAQDIYEAHFGEFPLDLVADRR